MHCPTCGKELRAVQVETMLGNPAYHEWCRNGYCSLECFKQGDARGGMSAAVVPVSTASASISPSTVPIRPIPPPLSPSRNRFGRTLATACLVTVPFYWAYSVFGQIQGIHRLPHAAHFYFVTVPALLMITGFGSGVAALCSMRGSSREGILWKAVIGLVMIVGSVVYVLSKAKTTGP
jgi:hypothetical protein